ncbi:hypothetical protein [Rhodanobacter sp. A1T4]|uniref:hypothetical protein n=1 Tax=Rhodanobacter sp. A1T4 TaxID=2723087 RepID=UPI00161907B1|nr:hypothetical protein [Rhodanobacter sp. A1T4]MBB6246360.1 hypothetical protein [Rhodanobacter sp. A1T4]
MNNAKTTKADLLRQLAGMQESVNSMKDVQVLKVGMQRTVDHMMMSSRSSLDLKYVDHVRESMQHCMARELAEQLIRSGAIKFREELRDDISRFERVVRIEGTLSVC